jgi:hypothetical protein
MKEYFELDYGVIGSVRAYLYINEIGYRLDTPRYYSRIIRFKGVGNRYVTGPFTEAKTYQQLAIKTLGKCYVIR